jgi:hypothetical protein
MTAPTPCDEGKDYFYQHCPILSMSTATEEMLSFVLKLLPSMILLKIL